MKMKKVLAITLVTAMVAGLAACGTDKPAADGGKTNVDVSSAEVETEASEPEAETASSEYDCSDEAKEKYINMETEDIIAEYVADPENPTEEEINDIIMLNRFNEFNDDYSMIYTGSEISAISSLVNDYGVDLNIDYKKYLDSEFEQLRVLAISRMSGFLFGTDDSDIDLVADLMENETNPHILYAIAMTFTNNGGSDERVAKFLLKLANDEDPMLRRVAAMAIGTSWNAEMEGAVDAEIALLQDENFDVRQAAAKYAGQLDNEAILPYLQALLDNAEDVELHGDVVDTLYDFWLDYPYYEIKNEEAYKMTVAYYNKTPRSEGVPQWTSFPVSAKAGNDEDVATWKAEAPFFNSNEFYTALAGVITDPDADWLSRTGAVEVALKLCDEPEKAALDSLINGLSDDNVDNLNIKDSYAQKLEKMKSE